MNGINVRTAVGRQLLVCCTLAGLLCIGESVGQVVDSEGSSAICDDNGRLQSDDAGPVRQFVFRIDVWWLEDGPEAEERDQRLEFLVQIDQAFRVLHSEEDAEFVVEGVLTYSDDGKVLLDVSIAHQRGWTKGRVNSEVILAPGIETYVGAAGPRFTVTLLPAELDSAPPDTP